jgi:hypothetical protein
MYGRGLVKFRSISFEEESQLEIIGYQAFAATRLTDFRVPRKVHSIEDYAFAACHDLQTFGSDSPHFIVYSPRSILARVKSGGDEIVSYAAGSNAAELWIHSSSIDSIRHGAVSNCKTLKTLRFWGSFDFIGDIGHNCPNLESIIGLEEIGEHILSYPSFSSTNLSSILIPANIKQAGGFCSNPRLSEIRIEEGVEILDSFASSTAVSSVVIPSTVSKIINATFSNCGNLTTIYCKAVIPPTLEESFNQIHEDAVIYVPAESVEAYQTAQGWSAFASLIKSDEYIENL